MLKTIGYVGWRIWYTLRASFFWLVSLFTKKGTPGDQGAWEWVQHNSADEPKLIENEVIEGSLQVRQSNITFRGCTFKGDVRILGPARNGESEFLRSESKKRGYVNWLRRQCPTNVRFENCRIEATGKTIPLYIAPGVTRTFVKNTKITGKSSSVMVYLDAESHGNTFEDCDIDGTFAGRETVAIDASDRNTFRRCKITFKKEAAILLYRNCGLKGTTRHTTPSFNIIDDNEFVRKGLSDIAIHVGSRRGGRLYCCQDKGYDIGSSASDRDHARYNDVTNNRLNGCRILESCGHSNIIKGNV